MNCQDCGNPLQIAIPAANSGFLNGDIYKGCECSYKRVAAELAKGR